MTIDHTIFAVDDTPYCMWDYDTKAINIEFIKSIDPSYFEYAARIHQSNLEGDDKQFAATALRLTYHHALETFFALICATLQAPHCIVGWIQKYQPARLRRMITAINNQNAEFLINLKIDRLDWPTIASTIVQFRSQDEKRNLETKSLFAKAWARFAGDFVGEQSSLEYNSLKHGLRARPGGFSLSFGLEHEYGISPPPNEMHVLGSSEFGNSFLRAQQILKKSNDPHFRIARSSIAWNPEGTAHALMLLANSIQNVASFLKYINGVDPTTFQFVRFTDDDVFQKPWSDLPTLSNLSMDYNITEDSILKLTRKQLKAALKKQLFSPKKAAS